MYSAIPFYRKSVNSLPDILPLFLLGPNLIASSQVFSTWSLSDVTMSGTAVQAPDNSFSAFKMIEGNLNTFHRASKVAASATSGLFYTFSVYAKPVERTWLRLTVDSVFDPGPGNPTAWFNLSGNGAMGSTEVVDHATIATAPNGYYRAQMSMQAAATGVCNAYVQMVLGNGLDAYAGDGASGFIPWGAQLNPGGYATGYLETP